MATRYLMHFALLVTTIGMKEVLDSNSFLQLVTESGAALDASGLEEVAPVGEIAKAEIDLQKKREEQREQETEVLKKIVEMMENEVHEGGRESSVTGHAAGEDGAGSGSAIEMEGREIGEEEENEARGVAGRSTRAVQHLARGRVLGDINRSEPRVVGNRGFSEPWAIGTVASLQLAAADTALKGFMGGFTDGTYGYAIPTNNGAAFYGKMVRFDLAGFATIEVLDLATHDPALRGFHGGFTDGTYGYAIPYRNEAGRCGKVVRFDLAGFAIREVLDLATHDPALKGFHGGFTDGTYGYALPFSNEAGYSGKVARFDLAGFAATEALDLATHDPALKGFLDGFTDGTYGYALPYRNGAGFSGKVARFDLAGFATTEALDLATHDPALKGFAGGFTDGTYGYAIPHYNGAGYSGKVARFGVIKAGRPLCAGTTQPGATAWQVYGGIAPGIYVDVDTTKCGFQDTPRYVTSLQGLTSHYQSKGSSEIYGPTPSGFRIYIYMEVTPALANERQYAIHWMAAAPGLQSTEGLCEGQAANWRDHGTYNMVQTVDTSACRFSERPVYVTSLQGTDGHWQSTGSSEVYSASANEFTQYIDGATPEMAASYSYKTNFLAFEISKSSKKLCAGRTSPDDWKKHSSSGAIYVDIDASACGFASTPVYVSSLHGTSSHWTSTGSSEVYGPTAAGFRIYVQTTDEIVSEERYNKRYQWQIEWLAAEPTASSTTTTSTATSSTATSVTVTATSVTTTTTSAATSSTATSVTVTATSVTTTTHDDQSSVVGDPHVVNVAHARFEIRAEGVHKLVQIPQFTQGNKPDLRVDAKIEHLVSNDCSKSFMTSLSIFGRWTEDAFGLMRISQGSDMPNTTLLINTTAPEKFSAQFPFPGVKPGHASIAFKLKDVSFHVGKHYEGRYGEQKAYLNVRVGGLRKYHDLGGLLGYDDHADAEKLAANCTAAEPPAAYQSSFTGNGRSAPTITDGGSRIEAD